MKLSQAVLDKEKSMRAHLATLTAEHQPLMKSTKYAYEVLYKDLPQWERCARSMAYGYDQQLVDIQDDDVVIGRFAFQVYQPGTTADQHPRPHQNDGTYMVQAAHNAQLEEVKATYPEMRSDFLESGLHGDAFWNGHEAHCFQIVLRLGWQGIRDLAERMLKRARQQKAKEFYQGVIITLDALIRYNDRYVEELERRGMTEQAAICRQVPRYPARNFREAVQCVNMVYFTVTQEGSGTWGPGWVDYYLWPYLEKDLAEGAITEQEAFDLCGYLLIQMDSRICLNEEMNDTVNLGGSNPNGTSAVSKLTYLFAEAILQLKDITSLLVYIKMPENPPEGFMQYAAEWLIRGGNRGQVMSDKAIASAMQYRGTPYHEGLSYTSNGCMEISCTQGNSDLLLCGWHNMPKFVEFAVTGNEDLANGKTYDSVHFKGLINCTDFEDFYTDCMAEHKRILHMYFDCIDMLGKHSAEISPNYYCSSLLNDCMLRGRNMYDGGTRYNDYGTSPVGVGSAINGLFAVKKAVFDNKICTAEELVAAMKANFKGYEVLQARLQAIAKYGQDDAEADEFAARYLNDLCEIYETWENRLGDVVKPVVFTFVWANKCGAHLGATPDGMPANTAVSHGTTPSSSGMRKGATAAIASNCKMPMKRFTGGGSSMWDFDQSWINPQLMEGFLSTFIDMGGQMFQGNTQLDASVLLEAQANPEAHQDLVVRVGGFSAHFVDLTRDVQNDVINRCRHNS